ncbi:MAG TPA: hypothetical protein VEJ45_03180, partial [Candidatus Acidoferrales bacterium]|nr:hypothetical protein [Candidatus Acidoferrales bacterium]
CTGPASRPVADQVRDVGPTRFALVAPVNEKRVGWDPVASALKIAASHSGLPNSIALVSLVIDGLPGRSAPE